MDIFTWLRRDHVEILNLVGEGTREARAQGAERWDIHVRIEENFLFPFLRSEPGLRHSLNRAVQAHDRIRGRMRGIQPSDPDSWDGSGDWLMESLERLQNMKERRIFPRARRFLSADESEELLSEVIDFLHGLENALSSGR